jgi:hypothetical protein
LGAIGQGIAEDGDGVTGLEFNLGGERGGQGEAGQQKGTEEGFHVGLGGEYGGCEVNFPGSCPPERAKPDNGRWFFCPGAGRSDGVDD